MLRNKKFLIAITVIALLLCYTLFSGLKKTRPSAGGLSAGSVVLALGDSLTAGYGAGSGEDYPSLLAKKAGWQVINAGINGNTSAQALERLPALLSEYHPSLVLISIGGNDFLQKHRDSDTEATIGKIIDTVKDENIPAVLIAVPGGESVNLLNIGDNPLYARLAAEKQVDLFANGWTPIIKDGSLKSDQVHPNAKGYAQFAEQLFQYLHQTGYY